MIYTPRILKLFVTAILFLSLCIPGTLFAQSPSAKSFQMDTDWEKIRDAQVQMLRNKEAELDRMKEELLTRAQPQARNQTGLPEVEAEFKKREADWLQKTDRYENEITLLKVKIEEQKKERDALRLQLDDVLKKQPVGQQAKFLDKKMTDTKNPYSSDLDHREAQIKNQESQIQLRQTELELRQKELKKAQDALVDGEKERVNFKVRVSQWEASQLQAEQKREAEYRQLETDRQAFESQKRAVEAEKARLAHESEIFQTKMKDLTAASDQAKRLLTRETNILAREEQLNLKLASIEKREKQIGAANTKIAEEQQARTNQIKQADAALVGKLAGAEAQIAQLRDAKKFSDLDRAAIAKQISDLQSQLTSAKSAADGKDALLKNREQDFLRGQGVLDSQLIQMKSRLEKEQKVFSEKEIQWKLQLDSLSQKIDQSEARFAQINNTKTLSDADRNIFLKQMADLQLQIQLLKKTSDDLTSNLKKSEQALIHAQASGNQQISDLQLRLESKQKELNQSENERKTQVGDLSKKLQEANAQLSDLGAELQEKDSQIRTQKDTGDQDWAKKVLELENKKADLKVLEEQLNKKSAALEAQSLHLEEKSNALREEQQAFLNQTKDRSSASMSDDTNTDILKLRQELLESKNENESWRQSKRQIEQSWADFVNKEMQYQIEISDLKKRNTELESRNAANFAVQTNKSGERDWSSEARKIVGDRRALGDEKARLYQQLNHERQEFEKTQIQFLRAQRDFEKYKQSEEIRIEKLRRQSVQS